MIPPPPANWPGLEGNSLACREKIKVLTENHQELAQVLRDTFEDAILMGVDEAAMRGILAGMIDGLESPKRASR
jgi:uncharacterized protein (UPF0335 family)